MAKKKKASKVKAGLSDDFVDHLLSLCSSCELISTHDESFVSPRETLWSDYEAWRGHFSTRKGTTEIFDNDQTKDKRLVGVMRGDLDNAISWIRRHEELVMNVRNSFEKYHVWGKNEMEQAMTDLRALENMVANEKDFVLAQA